MCYKAADAIKKRHAQLSHDEMGFFFFHDLLVIWSGSHRYWLRIKASHAVLVTCGALQRRHASGQPESTSVSQFKGYQSNFNNRLSHEINHPCHISFYDQTDYDVASCRVINIRGSLLKSFWIFQTPGFYKISFQN